MDKEKMEVRSMRLTDSQYKKYLSLGGNAWLCLLYTSDAADEAYDV